MIFFLVSLVRSPSKKSCRTRGINSKIYLKTFICIRKSYLDTRNTIDLLIVWCFTPYRPYFSAIVLVTITTKKIPKCYVYFIISLDIYIFIDRFWFVFCFTNIEKRKYKSINIRHSRDFVLTDPIFQPFKHPIKKNAVMCVESMRYMYTSF